MEIDVMIQFIQGGMEEEVKHAGTADPNGPGANIEMADLAGLDLRIGPDNTITRGRQVNGCKGSQETSIRGRTVNIGTLGRNGIPDEESFQGFRVMGKVMHQGFN